MAIRPATLWSIGALFIGAAAAVAVDFAGVRAALEDGLARERADLVAGARESPPAPAADRPAATAVPGPDEAGGEAEPAPDADPNEPPTLTGGARPPVARFDLVRAEPDGSLVIAGSGPARATMEIVAGSRTIATAQAQANGDFVAVLDEPLAPGDYQIVLRATAPDGVVVTSLETAIVAIPEPGSADVLALVEAPGAPSRLITTPGPRSPVLTPVPDPDGRPGDGAGADGERSVAGLRRDDGGPGVMATDAPDEGAGQAAAGEDGEAARGSDAGDAPPQPEPEDAAARTGEAASPAALPEAGANEANEPAPAAPGGGDAPFGLRIEAVEIDGPDLFVAGAAPAGARLRLYANAILLGDTVASEGGRFLVQVRRDLPVGDYIIRADAIDPRTGQVRHRASVPFTRSAGERLAAVAVAPSARLPASPPPIPFDALTPPAPGAGEGRGAVSGPAGAGAPPPASDPPAVATAPDANVPPTNEPPTNVPQALGVLQGPPPLATDVPQTTAELVPTGESVIIRRGDTLWQISRRVYGQGVKYTTIYLANRQQIGDPDRIWPGQVFDVPGEAIDDAEAVHRDLRARD